MRCAIQIAGFNFPSSQLITVNLAPDNLHKDSGRIDLPIVIGILAASGQIDSSTLKEYAFAGELSLSGDLRSVRGALAMVLGVRKAGHQYK